MITALKKYIENYSNLRKQILFNKNYLIQNKFEEEEIDYLQTEWIIQYLVNDFYTIKQEDINNNYYLSCFFITSIFEKSYITTDSALSYYWLKSPTLLITFAWNKNQKMEMFWTRIKEESLNSFWEYIELEFNINNWKLSEWFEKNKIKIATKEQALIDYFFVSRSEILPEEFNVVWFNKIICLEELNQKKILELAEKTNNEKTIKTANNFCYWLNNNIIDLK